MFGDSRQAVKEKEVFSLSETLSGNNLAGKANVAGYEDTDLSFYFDDSNGLKEMLYDFKCFHSKDESDRRYETIYKSLVQKYGEPSILCDLYSPIKKLANRNLSLYSVGFFCSGNVYVFITSKGLAIPAVSR